MNFSVENILDMISSCGEEGLQSDLAAFDCPQNIEIETFIRNKAIDFAKRKLSITYIVSDTSDGEIVGYFTLTHKAIDISGSDLSNASRKKLGNHSRYEADSDIYSTSAFLLAQFGKNYAVDNGTRISGTELMQCVMDILADIQHLIGGGVVYLDAEDKPELRHFMFFSYDTDASWHRHFSRQHPVSALFSDPHPMLPQVPLPYPRSKIGFFL